MRLRESVGPPTTDSLARSGASRAARARLAIDTSTTRFGRHRTALIALVASLALYGISLALIPAIGDEDAALHALHTLFPTDPSRLLSIWSRPLFAIPYLLPAQLGYPAMRVFTVLICAATAWLTYRVALGAGLRRAWVAIPLVLLQPVLLGVGIDTMTEPIFALVLAGGILAYANDRLLLAAAIWSLLPLGNPEGPFVLLLLAVLWLPRAVRDRRHRVAIVLLTLGMVVWEVLCYIMARDWLYLIHTFPWQVGSSPTQGTLLHFVKRWPAIVGWGILPFWIIGLLPGWRQRVLRLCILMVATIFVVHSLLFALQKMGSWGFDRYFAPLAPVNALIAVAGVAALSALAPRVMAYVIGILLALEAWQAFTTLAFETMNYMPAATREALDVARQRFDLRTRHVLFADNFGYVFLGSDWGTTVLPVGSHDVTAAAIDTLPAGTVVLWDDLVGDWWFHLSVQDFTERGYRLVWSRETRLGSRFAAALERVSLFRNGRLFPWLATPTGPPYLARPMHQALLVRTTAQPELSTNGRSHDP